MKFKQERDIQFAHLDGENRLKISAILSFMQDAADAQAREMRLNNAKLKESGVAWVLSRMAVSAGNLIVAPHGKAVTTTYPRAGRSIEYPRDYLLEYDGNIIARAESYWTIIDIASRRMLRFGELEGYSEFVESEDGVCGGAAKIRAINMTDGEYVYTYRVGNTDIDLVGHLNNIHYADIAVNALSSEEYARDISRFNISFIAEGKAGEDIKVYKRTDGDTARIQGAFSDGRVCFSAEIGFYK